MARTRSTRIEQIKSLLVDRAGGDYKVAGEKFPSARELATRYQISYQTADRLLNELVAGGHLVRRRGSGTYVAGASAQALRKALLIFNRRAERPASFGGEFLHRISDELSARRIPWETAWDDQITKLPPSAFPVLWEVPRALIRQIAEDRRFALVLNSAPEPGFQATWVDSVAVDDFSGGVCAAEMLRSSARKGRTYVMGGPKDDPRSEKRIAGFCSMIRHAKLVSGGTWFAEDATASARRLARSKAAAVFCCNDRLAQAVISACRQQGVEFPKLVGFDDAPIARDLALSTVALPWKGLVKSAADLIARRLSGDASHAARILLAPRPVFRSTTD